MHLTLTISGTYSPSCATYPETTILVNGEPNGYGADTLILTLRQVRAMFLDMAEPDQFRHTLGRTPGARTADTHRLGTQFIHPQHTPVQITLEILPGFVSTELIQGREETVGTEVQCA